VDDVEDAFKKFWLLPTDVKAKYKRPVDYVSGGNSGYIPPNTEIFAKTNSIFEVRESFNVTPCELMVFSLFLTTLFLKLFHSFVCQPLTLMKISNKKSTLYTRNVQNWPTRY
jgi:hypothetical protein